MTSSRWTRRATLAALAAAPLAVRADPAAPFARTFDRARGIDQLNALLIAQRGRIVAAEALRGPALDRPVNVKSVSKSVISALTGIAIARGELAGTEQLVTPLLRRVVPRRADDRVHNITVGHMLSMRSGLQQVSGDAYAEWAGSKHLIYEALSKPMVAEPGTEMLYSTASYHILGHLLTRVAQTDLHTLAQSRLGDPLGIDIPPWVQDKQGRYLGGNDMQISPLGLFRFGEMYRRGGDWDSRRILARDWITQSWTPMTNSVETGHGYGFGWFIWFAGGQQIFYARGYGGQMIYIVPELELTVVITSDPRLPATLDGHLGALNRLLTDSILPAAQSLT